MWNELTELFMKSLSVAYSWTKRSTQTNWRLHTHSTVDQLCAWAFAWLTFDNSWGTNFGAPVCVCVCERVYGCACVCTMVRWWACERFLTFKTERRTMNIQTEHYSMRFESLFVASGFRTHKTLLITGFIQARVDNMVVWIFLALRFF